MADFRELPEHELQRLSDDELIAYIRDARDAGLSAAAGLGLEMLVFGHWPNVLRRASRKLPSHVAEDVAGNAIVSAITSAFHGESVGQFVNWLNRIVDRRVADELRSRKPTVPLPEEHEGEDAFWGSAGAVADETGAVEVRLALEQALGELSDTHRDAVERFVLDGFPAAEVAEATGLSENNVHQIASRFRKRLREILSGGDTSP